MLVGFGHAGRDLHHRALRTLGRADDVLVVDPRRPDDLPAGSRWCPDLTGALAMLPDPAGAVFHVVTPVREHLPVVRRLVAAGARHILVEKPITASVPDAVEMAGLAEQAHIDAVSVWPASRVTERVVELVGAGRIGTLVALHMEQSKPRFRRGQADSGHTSAFEVELPHQVLLALHLAGPVAAVHDVRAWPSPLPGGIGGAQLSLRHTNGITSTLRSDLTAPIRIRRLRLTGTVGEIVADYPVSADDDFGQVRVTGSDREVLPDAPLTRLIELVHAHAAGSGPRPPGPLADHVSVITLLMSAKERTVLCTTP